MSNRTRRGSRRGIATVWALIVLGIVAAMSATTLAHFAGTRRQIDAHRLRTQAEWLARSGYELAVARLIENPNDYVGETISPIPSSEVKITVKADPEKKDLFQIEVEARYPTGEKPTIRTLRRTFQK